MADIITTMWFQDIQKTYKYVKAGGYYLGSGPQKMETGVKIHISATSSSADPLAHCVLPVVNELGIFHKLRSDTDDIAKAETDNQMRKFITIYPQSADQLDLAADKIETAMRRARGLPWGEAVADRYPIEGDLPYGQAGYIYLRHGNFIKDDPNDDRTRVSEALKAYFMEDKVDGLFVKNKYARN